MGLRFRDSWKMFWYGHGLPHGGVREFVVIFAFIVCVGGIWVLAGWKAWELLAKLWK